MASTTSNIAFAGLGAMGGGMAKNLVKKGFTVTGYDIAQPLVTSFVEAGGIAAKSPKEAASNADFLISMVANPAQTTSLLFEGDNAAIHGLGPNTTLMICSTLPPSFLLQLRHQLDEAFSRPDIRLLDCPVSGGTHRAAAGSLSIFASGPDAFLDAASPLLSALSANLYRMPGGISAGARTKAVHQLLAATNIIAAAEAMGLAASVGLNSSRVATQLANSATAASFFVADRIPHMVENNWNPLSALGIILKDTGIVLTTAREASGSGSDSLPIHTPLAAAAEQQYLRGVRAGLLREDDAALVKLYLPAAQPSLVAEMRDADAQLIESRRISIATIEALLAGIHLAASVEAMAFCKAVGIKREIMCEIVQNAAGWSIMFEQNIPTMLEKDSWSLADCAQAGQVGKSLEDAVEKCRVIGYPCPMASTALEQFQFAALRDKKIEHLSRKSR